jgi:signal peptidase
MLKNVGVVMFVAVALALVAPPASPVQISYVTSDSMEPTIGTGDGYVLVPAGDIVPGEIVTFYSAEREGYVTHRVVGTTTDGYLTRGDANPSTDQAAGGPPVERDVVAGQVLTVGGTPVLIPQLGTAAGLLRSNWMVLFGIVSLLVLRAFRGSSDRGRQAGEQSVLRSRDVVLPALLIAIVASTLLFSMGAAHSERTYSVTASGDENARALPVGENTTVSVRTGRAATPLTRVLVDAEGVTVLNTTQEDPARGTNTASAAQGRRLGSELFATTQVTLNAEIPAQAEPGPHTVNVSVYSYPSTLPKGALEYLHAVHPVLAALVSVLASFAPGYVLYWLLVDPSTPLRASRRRWLRRLGGR